MVVRRMNLHIDETPQGKTFFNLWILDNFMLFCSLLIFFKINLFEKIFQEYHLSVEQIGSRSGPHFVRPDLGPICLQTTPVDKELRSKIRWCSMG